MDVVNPRGDEPLSPEIAGLFAAKAERRRRLAALPFPEKVRLVVRMQRMVAPVWRARGKQVRVWDIEDAGAPPDTDGTCGTS